MQAPCWALAVDGVAYAATVQADGSCRRRHSGGKRQRMACGAV
ncbi:hypothetical protein ACLB1Q_13015 [Escherichia coli]